MSIHQPTRNQSRKFNNSDPEPNPGTEPGFSTEEEDDDDDDDDFDDGEDNNTDASYVETNVLLGYVEEEGKGDGDKNGDGSGNGNGDDRDEDGDGSISFLGGWPVSDDFFTMSCIVFIFFYLCSGFCYACCSKYLGV